MTKDTGNPICIQPLISSGLFRISAFSAVKQSNEGDVRLGVPSETQRRRENPREGMGFVSRMGAEQGNAGALSLWKSAVRLSPQRLCGTRGARVSF